MSACNVCGGNNFRSEAVTEIFEIDGRRIKVRNIPTQICLQCGEMTFESESAERLRRMAHGEKEGDVLQRVDDLLDRLAVQNARFSEYEVMADASVAIEEARSEEDE